MSSVSFQLTLILVPFYDILGNPNEGSTGKICFLNLKKKIFDLDSTFNFCGFSLLLIGLDSF